MEDAGKDAEDDVLRRDAAGIVEHLCSKPGTAGSACRHREISKVQVNYKLEQESFMSELILSTMSKALFAE